MLGEMIAQVHEHPRITVHTATPAQAGRWLCGQLSQRAGASPATAAGRQEVTIDHGVIIVATGAEERKTTAYLYGQDPRVVTQRELEEALAEAQFRLPEGRPRHGGDDPVRRIAHRGASLLQPRLLLAGAQERHRRSRRAIPRANVIILYRDIRTYGLREKYYQQARDLGVLFVRYDLDAGRRRGAAACPMVENRDGRLVVRVYDPVITARPGARRRIRWR